MTDCRKWGKACEKNNICHTLFTWFSHTLHTLFTCWYCTCMWKKHVKCCKNHMKIVWKLSGFHMLFHMVFHTFASDSASKPFPSYPFPLFQNESSWCTTFHMEMSLIFKTMKVQEKLISIWKVVHQDWFWNRGKGQLGNGLLVTIFGHKIFACSCVMTFTTDLS